MPIASKITNITHILATNEKVLDHIESLLSKQRGDEQGKIIKNIKTHMFLTEDENGEWTPDNSKVNQMLWLIIQDIKGSNE